MSDDFSDPVKEVQTFDMVELEKDTTGVRNFLIHNMSSKGLIFIFIVFIFFENLYIFIGTRLPSNYNTTTVSYPLSQEYSNNEATAKIFLEPLSPSHQIISMTGVITRHSTKARVSDLLILNGFYDRLKGNSIVKRIQLKDSNRNYTFEPGFEESSKFYILQDMITSEFDGLNISLVFKTDFHNVRGFKFSYTYADPNLSKFMNTMKLLLSSCALYALIGFLISLRNTVKFCTIQIFCIFLGIAAFVSTNPLSVLINKNSINELSPFLCSLLMFVFRFFVLYLIDSILNNRESIKSKFSMVYIPFLILYFILEMEVSSNLYHFTSEKDSSSDLSFTEKLLISYHLVFCLFVLSLLIHLYLKTDGKDHFKVIVYSTFILPAVATTLITEVFLASTKATHTASIQLMVYVSTHVLVSIVFLFLHHTIC
ncbi:hypothetical protein TRFO_07865 [Tritrichomonas foetus]|uniref:Intimal thickness related receptor IRP domain-containing protein n=1 Tax=Tritrichomonas foetus TaxID=1144522 RepID=A0A1J4JTF2_9EUKA|nr:hypothetical protein TRFO_07865 [Tritrichomonas foetus]|eukprot:OHT00549.1 hypothetical protein TRFO_07865 [Tritrichomonas foetus]